MDVNVMEDNIRNVMPNMNLETLSKVISKLQEIGVETSCDLVHVQEEDLHSILKPIEIRKLLRRWSSSEADRGQGITRRYTSSPSSSSYCSPLSSPGSPTSASSRSQSPIIIKGQSNQDPEWPSKVQVPFSKHPELKEPLQAGERLKSDLRKDLVRSITDEVRVITEHASKKQFEIVARRLVERYPKSLEDRIENVIVGSGHDSFMKQLISRNENMNRKGKTVSVKRKIGDEQTPTKLKKAKVNIDSYGCVNWSPVITTEEGEVMSKKQADLKDMSTIVEPDWVEVKHLMGETFPLQRKHINEGVPVDKIIDEWPFLTDEKVFLQHARDLIGIDIYDTLCESYINKMNSMTAFFRNKAQDEFWQNYTESKLHLPPKIGTYMPAEMVSIMKSLGEKDADLFPLADESASKEDIEKTSKQNWPRLLVHGDRLTAKNYTLIVDNRVIIYKMESFMIGVCVLFAAYYVFNIEYPKEAASTLEFIQRCFVGLNPDKGWKIDKKKKSTAVNPKVLRLINDISNFVWWKSAEQS